MGGLNPFYSPSLHFHGGPITTPRLQLPTRPYGTGLFFVLGYDNGRWWTAGVGGDKRYIHRDEAMRLFESGLNGGL